MELRREARRLLPMERVALCGRRCRLGHADVRLGNGVATYGAVQTCTGVWACPCCAAKIAEHRRHELRDLADDHVRGGGSLYMAAFTVRHDRIQTAGFLRRVVSGAWTKLISGRSWRSAREKWGVMGHVRALEITVGKNGWHPHLHVLFFLRWEDDAGPFGDWLFARWSRIVERMGVGKCEPSIWRFERAADIDAATGYVVKGNFDLELTSGHMKLAKGGNRTPFQLLADSKEGDREAGALFREFYHAFKGARQLTYSVGLRDDAPDDETVAAASHGEIIGTIPRAVFERLHFLGLEVRLLERVERDGWSGVLDFLQRRGLPTDGCHARFTQQAA